jgi:hypothetical protein
MWLGYRPITNEGRLVMTFGSGICLAAGVIALIADGAWPWTELAFCVAIPAVIVVNAIAFYKMDDGF